MFSSNTYNSMNRPLDAGNDNQINLNVRVRARINLSLIKSIIT